MTVNDADNSWTYTPDYYTLKHASHYVLPGAKLLPLAHDYADMLAFVNPDQSIVIIAGNQTEKAITLSLTLGNKPTLVTLTAQSLNTLVLRK